VNPWSLTRSATTAAWSPTVSLGAHRRPIRPGAALSRRRVGGEVCQPLRSFDRPALVGWTPDDRVQHPEHGRRLADRPRMVGWSSSDMLIMRVQPAAFARAVREFARTTSAVAG
jgi:hypothetical protein